MDGEEGTTQVMRTYRPTHTSCSCREGPQRRQDLKWVSLEADGLQRLSALLSTSIPLIQCSVSSEGSRIFQSATRKGFFSCSLGIVRGSGEGGQQNRGPLIKLKLLESKT